MYEREGVHAILDEALYCHLAWVGDDGDPRMIPTIHARVGDTLYGTARLPRARSARSSGARPWRSP